MPDVTPKFAFPYPNSADTLAAAVKAIPKALAQQVEATIAGFGGIANPGGWTDWAPALGSSAGAPYAPLGVRKVGVDVRWRGRLAGIAGGLTAPVQIGTAPAGFRPTHTRHYGLAASNVYVRLEVAASGAITLLDSIPANGWLQLDELAYPID